MTSNNHFQNDYEMVTGQTEDQGEPLPVCIYRQYQQSAAASLVNLHVLVQVKNVRGAGGLTCDVLSCE